METVAAVVITKNEERRIAACLGSVAGLADEIVVVDSGSVDGTVAIARQYTDRVFHRDFVSFPKQRNAAMQMAVSDWVLFVDADEQCTPELAEEIRRLVRQGSEFGHPVAYGIPRRNYMFGRWLRHAGWYPDYQYRFFQRQKGWYDEKRSVHELPVFDGPVGHLEGELLHFNYDSLGEFYAKQMFYAGMEAGSRAEAGLNLKWWSLVVQPVREFRRRFFLLEGWREGLLGLVLSALLAYSEFRVYAEIHRRYRQGRAADGPAL